MRRLGLVLAIGTLMPSLASATASAPGLTEAPGPARLNFAIPAQSLATALLVFGQQSNRQVLTAAGAVGDLQTSGVSGELTPEAALARLLRDSGLEYEPFDGATFIVRRPRPVPVSTYIDTSGTPEASLPLITAFAEIQVHAVALGDVGYVVSQTSGATRTAMPILQVPQSVSVVTRDQMDAQQATSVAEAVRNVAGVQYVDGFDSPALIRIRGFNAGNGMTDGMPNSIARTVDMPPLIGIERVEVLKGPETVMGDTSSSNNFGGLINVVMKRPQADPVRQVTYSFGRYDGARVGLDLGGPVSEGSPWTYRWIVSGNYADQTQQGYRGQRNVYLAPSIGWEGESTKLMLGVEYVNNRMAGPDHVVMLGDSLGFASPFGVLAGNPDDHASFRTGRFVYGLEQSLGSGWAFRSRGQYVKQLKDGGLWTFEDGMPNGYVDAAAKVYRYSDAYYNLQNDIVGSFEQGQVTHNIVLGFDYSRSHAGRGNESDYVKTSQSTSYDLFGRNELPNVRQTIAAADAMSATEVQTLGGAWSTETGLFLQDQFDMGERWSGLLALRRTTYQLHTQSTDGTPHTSDKSKWVPKAGLVYKATSSLSLYTNATTGFQANSLLGKDGEPLPPALSRQVEAGVKLDMLDHRARLTAAWYRIRLDHSVDLISPEPPYFATPGPGQTNRGVEMEFAGQIVPGLEGLASYTHATVHNDDGTPPTGSPRQQGSLWLNYRFQHGALRDWGWGAGISARSRAQGRTTDGTYFDIPGQASVEANVTYFAPHWRATLGVKNLFGRTLYAVNFDETFVPLRQGRILMLSGAYDF